MSNQFFNNRRERVIGYLQLAGVILFIVVVYFISTTYGK